MQPPEECSAGNPVVISTGEKVQLERPDFIAGGPFPLEFRRNYRSSRAPESQSRVIQLDAFTSAPSSSEGWTRHEQPDNFVSTFQGSAPPEELPWTDTGIAIIGNKQWSHNYHYSLVEVSSERLMLMRPDGQKWFFNQSGDSYVASNLSGDSIYPDGDGWRYESRVGLIERYNSDNQLIQIKQTENIYKDLSYRGDGLLSNVTHSLGGEIVFTYTPLKKIDTVAFPDGSSIQHEYDDVGNPVKIIAFQGTQQSFSRSYHYEHLDHPYHLTGITNERDVRYATWDYDSMGRAIVSQHLEGAADKVTFDYSDPDAVVVKNSLGKDTIYRYDNNAGVKRLSTVDGVQSDNCAAANKAYTYFDNGTLQSKTDWQGNITTFERDSLGQELSRTEASGTAQARTITTEWHPELNLPTRITEPERITEISYDDVGRVLSRTVTPRSSAPASLSPVAIAGSDQRLLLNNADGQVSVALDASASYDPNGSIVSYSWMRDGQALSSQAKPSIDLPAGTYQFDVSVVDNEGLSAVDSVSVVVSSSSAQGYSLNAAALIPGDANQATRVSFSATPPQPMTTQRNTANVIVEDNGNALRLVGNGWQFVPLNYSVTANTIIEFDYRLDSDGEILGIGWDTDMRVSSDTTFSLAGSQNWGIQALHTWQAGDSGPVSIPVGDYFTGNFNRLVFVSDDDANTGADSRFSNVRIYESDAAPSEAYYQVPAGATWQSVAVALYGSDLVADALQSTLESSYSLTPGERILASDLPNSLNTIVYDLNTAILSPGEGVSTAINFNATPPQAMTTQRNTANVIVEDSGNALRLVGNGWQFVPLNYSVTANTMIEFDYRLDSDGEILGIGWDTDMRVSSDTTFSLAGSQNWGIQALHTWQAGDSGPVSIPVGDYFTGNFNRLVFVSDDDANTGADSRFSNVRIYESDAAPSEAYYQVPAGATWQSIALTLYGSADVADALQAALQDNYDLSEGLRIPQSDLPDTLSPSLNTAQIQFNNRTQEVAHV